MAWAEPDVTATPAVSTTGPSVTSPPRPDLPRRYLRPPLDLRAVIGVGHGLEHGRTRRRPRVPGQRPGPGARRGAHVGIRLATRLASERRSPTSRSDRRGARLLPARTGRARTASYLRSPNAPRSRAPRTAVTRPVARHHRSRDSTSATTRSPDRCRDGARSPEYDQRPVFVCDWRRAEHGQRQPLRGGWWSEQRCQRRLCGSERRNPERGGRAVTQQRRSGAQDGRRRGHALHPKVL